MASEIYAFNISVPAGTPISAPQITALSLPPRTVQAVEWLIPPGPRGLLGFALGSSGQPTIPYGLGSWIIGDDVDDHWDLTDQIESGAWQVWAYNTGDFRHTVYLRFLLAPLSANAPIIYPSPLPAFGGTLDLGALEFPPLVGLGTS